MKYSYKIIKYILCLLLFVNIINAQFKEIKILINRPIIEEDEGYLNKYNSLMKQAFVNDEFLSKFDINFEYCKLNPEDGKEITKNYKEGIFIKTDFIIDNNYPKEFNCTLRELKESNFDMMILDNGFLFSDDSFVKSIFLNGQYSIRRITDYYLNYDNYKSFLEGGIGHHDASILNYGKFKDSKLFGLPYEIDFNTLYYHNQYNASLDALLDKGNNKGNSLNKKSVNSNGLMSAGYGDNDELLESFVEFVSNKHGIPKETDVKSFNIFYNTTFRELFKSYREDILKNTGNEIQKTLETTVQQAYNSFVAEGKPFFKGKASLYKSLKENNNIAISMSSLPGDFSVLQKKYIIVNNKSTKSKVDLVKVAIKLTSPEMQIYRSQVFGSIPTFDMGKISDPYIAYYCRENFQICSQLSAIKPIHINTFFKKNKYSANYMETRLVLPTTLKDDLIKNDGKITENLFMNILDNEMVPLDDFSKLILGCNGINIFILLSLIVVIFLVFKYRKHPYMKAISPYFCMLTITGIVMNLSFIYVFGLSSISISLCRFSYVFKVTAINLIYLPMIAIIFRIYYIYTNLSKVNFGKEVNNKHLFMYIFTILAIIVGITSIIAFNDDFYIGTFGSLLPIRFDLCVYNNMFLYYYFANIYSIIMFVIMMVLTFKTIKVSKKFGEVKFILFIVLLLFGSIVYEITFIYLATFNFDNIQYFVISHVLYLLSSLLCVYLLVGSRILYLIKHRKNDKTSNYNDYADSLVNIADFIPLKRGKNKDHILNNKYNEINKRSNVNSTLYSNNMNQNSNIINYSSNTNTFSFNNTNTNSNINTFSFNNTNTNSNNSNKSSNYYYNNIRNSNDSNCKDYKDENVNHYVDNYINNYNDYMRNYNEHRITSGEYIDPIDSNPNNYFFNQSLKMLSQKDDEQKQYKKSYY